MAEHFGNIETLTSLLKNRTVRVIGASAFALTAPFTISGCGKYGDVPTGLSEVTIQGERGESVSGWRNTVDRGDVEGLNVKEVLDVFPAQDGKIATAYMWQADNNIMPPENGIRRILECRDDILVDNPPIVEEKTHTGQWARAVCADGEIWASMNGDEIRTIAQNLPYDLVSTQ